MLLTTSMLGRWDASSKDKLQKAVPSILLMPTLYGLSHVLALMILATTCELPYGEVCIAGRPLTVVTGHQPMGN